MAMFRFASSEELLEKFRRSKIDLFWLEKQAEESTGQPHAVYTQQWEKEFEYHNELEEELRKRGLVQ